jgi:hypothetical protein
VSNIAAPTVQSAPPYSIVIAAVGFSIYYKFTNTPSAMLARRIANGKTAEQQRVIEYFVRDEGCLNKNMSDDEYKSMVRAKRDTLNLKARALSKIGLDEDQVSEIFPAMFEGFVYKNAYAKRQANGGWVSSSYQVSWVFFSSDQIYLYSYTLNMDDDNKKEQTDEFFYKDVTSFSTSSETEKAKGNAGQQIEVETNKFAMVVPGDKLYMSMDGVIDADRIIQGMKQKLREKKAQ